MRGVLCGLRNRWFSAGAVARTPLEELTTLPQTPQSFGDGNTPRVHSLYGISAPYYI